MSKIAFIIKIFRGSTVTDEEIVRFAIKNYFLQGETLEDFQDDLVLKYNRNKVYAKEVKKRF